MHISLIGGFRLLIGVNVSVSVWLSVSKWQPCDEQNVLWLNQCELGWAQGPL